MKTYRVMRSTALIILKFGADYRWVVKGPPQLFTTGKNPDIHSIRGRVGTIARINDWERKAISCPYRNSNPEKCNSYHCHVQTSFTPQSVLRQFHGLFQSESSTQCDIVLPLSYSGTLSFLSGHPVAVYFFLLVFPSLLLFLYLSSSNIHRR